MAALISAPVVPPQGPPGTIQFMNLYVNYEYSSYLVAFNQPPPVFQPSPPGATSEPGDFTATFRGWFDTTADPTKDFTFSYLDQTSGTVKTGIIRAGNVSRPNIPTPTQLATQAYNNLGNCPMPICALYPGEEIVTIAGFTVVMNPLPQTAATASGQFTQDDRNLLALIYSILSGTTPVNP